MVDAGDFDARATHAVGDNVGRFGDDQFPRAGDPAGGPELRVFGEELFDAVEDVEGDALGGCRVVLGVSAKRFGGRGSIPEIREGSYRAKCLLLLARLPGLDPVHDALVGSTLARRKQWPGQCPRLPLVGVEVGGDRLGARNERERPVLLASIFRRSLVERPTRTEKVVVVIGVQFNTRPKRGRPEVMPDNWTEADQALDIFRTKRPAKMKGPALT